jgi:hypothetical protein
MEPRPEELKPSTPRPEEKTKRFRLIKLEERIAPSGPGHSKQTNCGTCNLCFSGTARSGGDPCTTISIE